MFGWYGVAQAKILQEVIKMQEITELKARIEELQAHNGVRFNELRQEVTSHHYATLELINEHSQKLEAICSYLDIDLVDKPAGFRVETLRQEQRKAFIRANTGQHSRPHCCACCTFK